MVSLQETGIPPKYHLTLYIAGDEPNSRQALDNLREICTDALAEQYEIEVVDVYKDFQRALNDRVIVTPTLIVLTGNPITRAVFFGSLNDKRIVLRHLGIEVNGHE